MKLLVEPRVAMKGSSEAFMRYSKLVKLDTCIEKIKKVFVPSARTGRKLRAAVLHGPRNLKLEYIPEMAVRPTQVRVDVRYCGLSGSDALLWRGEHRKIPEPTAILGFEVSGTILEMGGLAHERTGYQVGEEVVVHNYPVCGGLAENCLADYRDVFRLMRRVSLKNAAAVADDYFSALLAMGRRARIQKHEYFIVSAKHSRSALAVIDLATGIFGAKPIAVCNDARRAKLCTDLGAAVVCDTSLQCLRCKYKEISGQEEARVIIETDGESYFRNIIKCIKNDGLVAFIGCARNRRPDFHLMPLNYTVFAVAAKHYKIADTLIYRETMQELLGYQSECTIRPHISAIFGLYHINDAFDYYTTVPSGRVLIDMKDCNRLTLYDEF